MEAKHLDVVADVADHRQLARCERVVEPGGELCAANAPRGTTFTARSPP